MSLYLDLKAKISNGADVRGQQLQKMEIKSWPWNLEEKLTGGTKGSARVTEG